MSLGENAVLLGVRLVGAPDAYGDTTQGGSSWSGRVACHLRRRRSLGFDQGLATLEERDQLIVRLAAGAPTVTPGDRTEGSTILVEDRRAAPFVERRFRVAGVTVRSGGGTIADSVLMELADGD